MDIKKEILTRFAIVYVCIAIFGTMVVAKIITIQFSEGDELKKMNKKQQTLVVKPKRGDIFSRDGKLLACSVPVYDVSFDYRIQAFNKSDTLFTNNVDALAEGLGELFGNKGKNKKYFLRLLNKAARNDDIVVLAKQVDYITLQKIKKLPILKEGAFKGGLNIQVKNKREYPYSDIAKRTIGRVKEDRGITGLEMFYEKFLYGESNTITQDSESVSKNDENGVIDGYDLITTIDTEIQSIANEELLKAVQSFKAVWGCAIVMDVKTGELLAITNLSHNTLNPADTGYYEIENFAVDHRCDPGSTIKLSSLLIALEDNMVSLDDVIDTGDGHIRYVNKGIETNVYDWNYDKGGFQELTVKKVFANSSNVGVSKIIYNNYVATKKEWDYIQRLKSMGLDKPCGIDLINERTPLVKDPSMTKKTDKQKWEGSSLIQMSYGYDIELTPLQLLNFYNAVANNGTMVQPHLVKEIRNNAQTIKTIDPIITNNSICSKSTIEKVKILMEAVVTEGTAKSINNKYYKIAGKTGTAQTYVNGKYDDKILRASFCGYFPADNPKYSCIVVIQGSLPYDPYKVSGHGAAEIFKKISDRIYFNDHELRNQLLTDSSAVVTLPRVSNGYSSDYTKIFSTLEIPQASKPKSTWSTTIVNESNIDYKPIQTNTKVVPNLIGMGMRDAVYLAESKGLMVTCKGYGRLIRQSIPAGAAITKKQTIILEFK